MAKQQKEGFKINTTAVALGTTALATAAIGAYWLYGSKDASKNRKAAASWILKARAEVMDAIGKISDIDKQKYFDLVDGAIQKYAQSHDNASEVATVTKEMKAAWSHIQAATKPVKKAYKKIANKK